MKEYGKYHFWPFARIKKTPFLNRVKIVGCILKQEWNVLLRDIKNMKNGKWHPSSYILKTFAKKRLRSSYPMLISSFGCEMMSEGRATVRRCFIQIYSFTAILRRLCTNVTIHREWTMGRLAHQWDHDSLKNKFKNEVNTVKSNLLFIVSRNCLYCFFIFPIIVLIVVL